MLSPEKINYFAETDARNKRVRFGIKASDRTRHVYVIGKTGMGKSTLLENMAVQDIQNGEGVAFIDPHGKTAELFLDYVPKERIKDVIYFAPYDLDYPVSFNVMEDVGYEKRHLVANGLMSAFKKIWVDAWSARMEYILNNILLSLLEYPDSTLIGVNRMLVDKDYRKLVVDNISDPSVKAFWTDEFAKYGDRYMQEAGAAIQNKIGQFISNPMIRNIIGQPKSSFDIRDIMDKKKILIINLSKGRVGEGNANLLGSMLITKIYLGAMSRADLSPTAIGKSPNFYLYVDEFQSFANESFADILSEARKYKLNLTIAHQYIEQMSEEVRAAVFGNVGTMVTFRVGAFDAEVLEKEFMPYFTAQDLVNLGFVQIYLKLMIDGVTSQPFSATTLPPIEKNLISYKQEIIAASRDQFARSRVQVEIDIKEWHQPIVKAAPPRREGEFSAPREPRREESRREEHKTTDGQTRRPPPADTSARRDERPRGDHPGPDRRPAGPMERQRNEVSRHKEQNKENREADLRKVLSDSYSHISVPASSIEPDKESLVPRDRQRPRPEDNMKSLKSALESVLKAQAASAPKPTPVAAPTPQPAPVQKVTAPQKEESREVPEETLKKILKGE